MTLYSYCCTVVLLVVLSGCNSDPDLQYDHVILNLGAMSNTITHNNEQIVYSGWDTAVHVYSLETRSTIFSAKTGSLCYAKPVIARGRIYFPFSTEKFFCMDMQSRSIVWSVELEGRCSNFDFIDDSTIVASVKGHGLMVLNADRGKILYELLYDYNETLLPDASPWPVVSDSSNFYVSNWQKAALSSFRKKDGRLSWKFEREKIGVSGKGIIFNNEILIGTNEAYERGELTVLNASTGEVLHRHECKYEERMEPVIYNDRVYFYSYDSYLNEYNTDIT